MRFYFNFGWHWLIPEGLPVLKNTGKLEDSLSPCHPIIEKSFVFMEGWPNHV